MNPENDGSDDGIDVEYERRPYKVLVEDYDGDRVELTVNAIGPKDAKGVGRQTAIDRGFDVVAVLRVQEVGA